MVRQGAERRRRFSSVRDARLNAVCRCFAVDLDWNAVAARFGVDGDEMDAAALPRPSYNITPGRTIALVAQGKDGRRHLAGARWGLIPSWNRQTTLTYPTYNARIESAAFKPTFAESARSMRAVIPASGYYEFHGRRPFYFRAPDGRPLAMAGLFSWWRADSSPWMLTATILTSPAVDGPATVHDRMPVLLPSGMTAAWLDRSIDGTALLAEARERGGTLSRSLVFHEVAPFSPSADGRRLIRPMPRVETPTLF